MHTEIIADVVNKAFLVWATARGNPRRLFPLYDHYGCVFCSMYFLLSNFLPVLAPDM